MKKSPIPSALFLLILFAIPAISAAGELFTEPITGMKFIKIPSGCFDIGTPEDAPERYKDESLYRICLESFWMGITEVTNAQYRKFKPKHDSGAHKGLTLNRNDQPAVQVSWDEATVFAQWLTDKHKGRFNFRLPSEPQWEYACRGGTTTLRYWGDNPHGACKYANVFDNTAKKTFSFPWPHHHCTDGYAAAAPVGKFAANAFGLHDMIGNVWEWCRKTYSSDKLVSRVVRGGGWSDEPRNTRSAMRDGYWTKIEKPWVGFRLVIFPIPE